MKIQIPEDVEAIVMKISNEVTDYFSSKISNEFIPLDHAEKMTVPQFISVVQSIIAIISAKSLTILGNYIVPAIPMDELMALHISTLTKSLMIHKIYDQICDSCKEKEKVH